MHFWRSSMDQKKVMWFLEKQILWGILLLVLSVKRIMKTLQWLSIWGAFLLWKFYETWMSPLEKWIKHIPHNLICNSTGFQTHWWIPAHSGFPQCLPILTHLAGLFIFLSYFAAFPFPTDSLPQRSGELLLTASLSQNASWSVDL